MRNKQIHATIYGSGFGLYGYLPALLAAGATVALPHRYSTIIKTRQELQPFYESIEWFADGKSPPHKCNTAILAVPPAEQYDLALQIINNENIEYIVLEKPLAISPEKSEYLLKKLIASQKKFRIGYNFRFTEWGQTLLKNNAGCNTIEWDFMANHHAQNKETWKKHHEQGGGALRFYGIHLVALLTEMGYTHVAKSEIAPKATEWVAQIAATKNLPACNLRVKTDTPLSKLHIHSTTYTFEGTDPFSLKENAESSLVDRRIPYIQTLLNDLFDAPFKFYDWYIYANRLWLDAEHVAYINQGIKH